MPQLDEHQRTRAPLGVLVTLALLVAAVGSLVWVAAEALEERGVAVAAVELHLAVKTVVATDALRSAGETMGSGSPGGLVDAVSVIERNRDVAFHGLTDADRARAEELATRAAARGRVLMGPAQVDGPVDNHHDLQLLLDLAFRRSDHEADVASRRAGIISIVGGLVGLVAIVQLQRSRRRELGLRQELIEQASTDLLTGLPNRRGLERATIAATSILEGATSDRRIGFIVIDLDGFKTFNDLFGHRAGDEVLQQVAARLVGVVRPSEQLFRLGGDEFGIMLTDLDASDDGVAAAERYLAAFDHPFDFEARVELLRPSVGVATTDDPTHIEWMFVEADLAMYEAKRGGGGSVAGYDPSQSGPSRSEGALTRALRSADYDREFSLVYQPIVRIENGELLCHEALLRWSSREFGAVGPADFIPVAERNGEICTIGRWVLRMICEQLAAWNRDPATAGAVVSWNVSSRQLAQRDFVPEVLTALDGPGIDRHQLIVEVTESAVIDSTVAARRLETLRASGVRVAIDDFGSGYSNLGQLLEVPVDIIKIDRSLLVRLTEMRQRLGGDPSQPCAIMGAIVSIAAIFESVVVCEGVETDLQRLSLQRSGVTHAQGYLVGRPTPPRRLVAPAASGTELWRAESLHH